MELQLSATWILEIFASILSVLCLGGLIGVLAYADGQIVVSWHGLTLNTIISILGTGSKLCAMFALGAAIAQSKWAIFSRHPRSLVEFEAVEQAGRGPFGAAKLLIMTRKVATIGAIAVLLSLAFDPFAQQLVQFKQDLLWKSSPAVTLPRTQRYSAGNRVPVALAVNYERGSGASTVHVNADFSLQSGVLYGLTKPIGNVTQQLQLGCPSGNCTWPVSQTMAVCSICHELTDRLQKSHSEGAMPGYIALDQANSGATVGNLTRFQLPNGLWIDNVDDQTPGLQMTAFGTGNPAKTVSMKSIDTLIWSMTTMRVASADQNANWPTTPLTSECALYYCVKLYNTTVTNGTISQTSETLKNATRSAASWKPQAGSGYYPILNRTDLQSLEYDSAQSGIDRTDLQLGDSFNVSQNAVDSISSFFQTEFAYNVTQVSGLTGYVTGTFGSPNVQYAPDTMSPLYNSTDLEATFSSIAESMSNVIRAAGDSKIRVSGESGTPITRFSISWPWIALPAAVILLAVAQLFVTMWTSRNVPLWKGSTLATMSRGPYIGDVLSEAETVEDMHKAAAGQSIHLFSHTAPGGVAAAENSRTHEKYNAQVSVNELTGHGQGPPRY